MEIDENPEQIVLNKTKRKNAVLDNNINKPLPKKRKKNIPKTVKEAVWNTYIGDSFGKIKCPLCQMNDITQLNFHCAHVIAEAKGGKTTIENLRPICASCNLSMGQMNLFDFHNKYFKL